MSMDAREVVAWVLLVARCFRYFLDGLKVVRFVFFNVLSFQLLSFFHQVSGVCLFTAPFGAGAARRITSSSPKPSSF